MTPKKKKPIKKSLPDHKHPLRQALLSELVTAIGGYNANPPVNTGRFRSWEEQLGDDNQKIVAKLLEEHKRQVEYPLNEKMKIIALRLFDEEAKTMKLTEEKQTTINWKDKAKEDAGFDRNVSFDVVWAQALKALRNGGAGWTAFDKNNPPPEQKGPGKGAGWSAWYECLNGDNTDDGLMVFTAAYSHNLDKWQDITQQRRGVTHYRPLPTLESIKS